MKLGEQTKLAAINQHHKEAISLSKPLTSLDDFFKEKLCKPSKG
jgi:hypothetical protein